MKHNLNKKLSLAKLVAVTFSLILIGSVFALPMDFLQPLSQTRNIAVNSLRTLSEPENIQVEDVRSNLEDPIIDQLDTGFLPLPEGIQEASFPKQRVLPPIADPTGKTPGYDIPPDTDYFELLASRDHTSRHWYNTTSQTYTYQSDSLVHQPGIVETTNWVTEEEYPQRFILKLTNGTVYSFSTPLAMMNGIADVVNTSIWGVAFDSFHGMMGFYLNFADTTWGHGQYLYYPRLQNCSLPMIPLYAIYPHLYVKVGTSLFDKILNDRSLYSLPSQNPRNTLQFFQINDTWGMKFSTPEINIFGSTWNVVHGFKYNQTDGLFHMINEIECLTHDFDDIGFAYEVTSTPQTDGTAYQPAHFLFSNETHQVLKSVVDVWDAGTLLTDFSSEVELFSENEQTHIGFTFEDMEQAGFTQKYLNLHNQQLPDGNFRKTLRFGMYGYGVYTKGTQIEIDPSPWTSQYETWDLFRLYGDTSGWYTTNNYMRVGRDDTYEPGQGWLDVYYDCFFAFNTGLFSYVDSIWNVSLRLYAFNNYMESGEGVSSALYNIHGNFDDNSAKEYSKSFSELNKSSQSAVFTGTGTGWQTMDAAKTANQLNNWADWRHNNVSYLSFRLYEYGTDARTTDTVDFRENSYANYEPELAFEYNTSTPVISGIIQDSSNTTLSGVQLDLYDEYNAFLASDTTDVNGSYSLEITASNYQYRLWAWHTSYVTQNIDFIPTTNQTCNFTLQAETVPSCSPSTGYNNPTVCSDEYTGWVSESSVCDKGGSYAIGINSTAFIRCMDFTWNIQNVPIQGVYVYLHWKSVVDDTIRLKLLWLGSNSGWLTLDAQSSWGLSKVNFTSFTSWTPAKINSEVFHIQVDKVTNGTSEPILLDWVSSWVEYTEIRVTEIDSYYSVKGGANQSFKLKFKNFGTLTSGGETVDVKVKLEALDYDNYHTWVYKNFSFPIESLDPGETTENYSYASLPQIFQGYTDPGCTTWDGWFAMNIGDYNITDVFISTDTWNSTSGTTNDGFYVKFWQTHRVFVAAILCDDITPSFAENLFSDLETNDNFITLNGTKINGSWIGTWENTTFTDQFSIDFVVIPFESSYNTSLISTEMWKNSTKKFTKYEAKNQLGLTNNWTDHSGISNDNQGFDLILCLINTSDVETNPYGDLNRIFMNYAGGSGTWNSRTLLHEVGHVYMPDRSDDHLTYNPIAVYNASEDKWYYNLTYRCGNYSGSPYGGY
ncbi:MAG: carboxypeptidase-like regulatory domain-containing protein, partial [Candidatus Hodarchaeales archaeon]